MTLGELQERIQTVNSGGIKIPTILQMKVHQQRAFNKLFSWCEPLNLLVAYDDSDIAKIVDSVWRLKKPLIAETAEQYIDIDERLDEAFVYMIISLLCSPATKRDMRKEEFEDMAYNEALQYATGVQTIGYDNAKRVYEQESFITGVEFDCLGRIYRVSREFVDRVIDCILCGRQCLSSAEAKQIDLYKKYIAGNVRAVDKEKLLAVDKAVFFRLLNDPAKLTKYSDADLMRTSTLFCEFSKIDQNLTAEAFAITENKRAGFLECDKPMCNDNNRGCDG